MSFFLRQKVQILSKILPQIPNFANFVKFHQTLIFSSRRPVFVISSVFHQKRNPLELSYVQFLTGMRCWRTDCPWPRGWKIMALASASKRSDLGLGLEDHWPWRPQCLGP